MTPRSPWAARRTHPIGLPLAQKDLNLTLAYPQLAALIPSFLKNRRLDVITMRDALGRGKFEIVERLGHAMRGVGASFGFQAITYIGEALELGARRADMDASRKSVGELSLYLDRVDPE